MITSERAVEGGERRARETPWVRYLGIVVNPPSLPPPSIVGPGQGLPAGSGPLEGRPGWSKRPIGGPKTPPVTEKVPKRAEGPLPGDPDQAGWRGAVAGEEPPTTQGSVCESDESNKKNTINHHRAIRRAGSSIGCCGEKRTPPHSSPGIGSPYSHTANRPRPPTLLLVPASPTRIHRGARPWAARSCCRRWWWWWWWRAFARRGSCWPLVLVLVLLLVVLALWGGKGAPLGGGCFRTQDFKCRTGASQ